MYLEKLHFENAGPIKLLEIDISSNDGKAPKPIVFVGKNGSGKSIVLSQIVSSIINSHGAVYEDSDVQNGKVYKLRSSQYIRHGEVYSLTQLDFSDGFFEHEIVLKSIKEAFEEEHGFIPPYKHWAKMDAKSHSSVHSNFHDNMFNTKMSLSGPHLFFPPNRFEDPAWLNEASLLNKVNYFAATSIEGQSDRQVIQYAPMKLNQSWLLDLIYDALAIEKKFIPLSETPDPENPIGVIQQVGPANTMVKLIEQFILTLLSEQGPINWNVGARSRRTIGISNASGVLISNLLSLSTGQAVLLDLFLTIIRHTDLSEQHISSLEDIRGLVVIDEVDLHLHTDLQYEMLPALIGSLPKVQFIMSSHSPLFLLGMEKTFSDDGFKIVELPSGESISAERFVEFERAYQHFASTRKFESEVSEQISKGVQPLLIVEGTTDKDYIIKAAEYLDEVDLLDKFEFLDGDGSKGLDKIWKNLHIGKWDNASQTVILLYDCDVKGKNNEIGKAYQRTISSRESMLTKGIENLFTPATIKRARNHKEAFIDFIAPSSGMIRGKPYNNPKSWTINPDEKRNLCDWLCNKGTKKDFDNFREIFDILRKCLA